MTGMEGMVLGPLIARADAEWYKAPPEKWCAAQIVQHLALALDYSARTFDARRDRPPMRRRPRTPTELVAYALIMGIGWAPSRRAPPASQPAPHPERGAVERQFHDGVARFLAVERDLLPARAHDLFVKHPVLGDLTLPEWRRFHLWHCAHHAKQIRARLAG